MANETTAPPPASERRTSRWLKVAFVLSLAVNVLFFGAIAGAWWRGGGPFGGRGAGNIVSFMASLPPERRADLMQRSKGLREQTRALRQVVRQAARDRAAALLAEPFDKQRFIDAQTRQIEAEQRLRLAVRDVMAEAASNMSEKERKAFLNWRHAGPPGDGPEDAPPPKR